MTIDTIGAICVRCGRVRGKHAKPWNTCLDCGGILCLQCSPAQDDTPLCVKCYHARYEERQRIRKSTPVECVACHTIKLPDEFVDNYTPTVCKSCDTIKKNALAAERSAREELAQKYWKPGTTRRVVVDNRYTYETNLPVKIGSKVLLPPSPWAHEFYGDDPWEGVVTSFISEYTGECSTIISIIE